MTKWEDITNADKIWNSMDDVKGNVTEQEAEPPSKAPRLKSSQEEKDEYVQPTPKIASLDNILEETDLDANFNDNLAWEIKPTARQKSHKNPKHQALPLSGPPSPKLTTLNDHHPPPRRTRYKEGPGLQDHISPMAPPLKPFPHQFHGTSAPSPSPPRHASLISTQAIPFNFNNFPSPSQRAHQLEEPKDDLLLSAPPAPEIEQEKSSVEKDWDETAEFMPSIPLDPASDSPPRSPGRFFTSSSYHELMYLALYRSRRTAALEKIRRLYCPRVIKEAAAQPPEERKPLPNSNQLKSSSPPNPSLHDEEDNHSSPPSQEPASPSASQESYRGAWVDKLPPELLF